MRWLVKLGPRWMRWRPRCLGLGLIIQGYCVTSTSTQPPSILQHAHCLLPRALPSVEHRPSPHTPAVRSPSLPLSPPASAPEAKLVR